MSLGTLKAGEDKYYDVQLHKMHSREWFKEQTYLEIAPYAGNVIPQEIQEQINRIIGDLLADIQNASFVSQQALKSVPGPDYNFPDSYSSFPRGSTLSTHRLATTIYNSSGDIVRRFINLSNDEDLREKVKNIKASDDDEAVSHSTLHFQSEFLEDSFVESIPGVNKTRVFSNVELLNEEARKLLELLGDGVVDAVRDYVGLIAKEILDSAVMSYSDLHGAVRFIPRDISENGLSEDAEYSTLSPHEITRWLQATIKMPLLQILVRLPKNTADKFYKQVYGGEPPKLIGG